MSGEFLNAKIGGVPNTKIHIRNIPPHITENHLRSIFGNIGYIKDLCYFNKNKKQMNNFLNTKVYNTALITFNTHEEALSILQNIHSLIDTSGEEKTIEAKFAIPNSVINNNTNNNNSNNNNSNNTNSMNNMNSTNGNLFDRNNYGMSYSNNQNSYNDMYNSSSIKHNGNDMNNIENTFFNNSASGSGNLTGGSSVNTNLMNRSFKNRNNQNSNNFGGMGNKQMNALGNGGVGVVSTSNTNMNSNNYMFMHYNNNNNINNGNNKNDPSEMGRENDMNANSTMRQNSYQLNNNYHHQIGGNNNMSSDGNNSMHNNNNNNTNLFSNGESPFCENENENNIDGLSLWESYRDSNNNVYYYNNLTKHSQWKKPIHPSKLFQYNNTEKVKQNGPTGSNLFIFHIPSEWNDADLFEHFCCFGNIISSKIQRDSTGRNSGFGFVSYDNTISAQHAIQQMNGYFVNNKYLKVQLKKGEVVNEAQA